MMTMQQDIIAPTPKPNHVLTAEQLGNDEGMTIHEINTMHNAPDSFRQAAEQINYDHNQYDHNLRQQYDMQDPVSQQFSGPIQPINHAQGDHVEYEEQMDVEEQHPKPKQQKKKKTSLQQRVEFLTSRNTEKENLLREQKENLEKIERENEKLRHAYQEMVLLKEKDSLEQNINRLNQIMVQAKEEEDHNTYVEADKYRMNLLLSEREKEYELNRLKQDLNQRNSEEESEQRYLEELNNKIQETLHYQSDVRDLKSEHYDDFLGDFPEIDPRNLEFYDPDIAEELLDIKKNFNKQLKRSRNYNHIGSLEYYDSLREMFGHYFDQNRAPAPQQQQQQQQQPQQYHDQYAYEHYPNYDQGDPDMANYNINLSKQELYDLRAQQGMADETYLPPSTYMSPEQSGQTMTTPTSQHYAPATQYPMYPQSGFQPAQPQYQQNQYAPPPPNYPPQQGYYPQNYPAQQGYPNQQRPQVNPVQRGHAPYPSQMNQRYELTPQELKVAEGLIGKMKDERNRIRSPQATIEYYRQEREKQIRSGGY